MAWTGRRVERLRIGAGHLVQLVQRRLPGGLGLVLVSRGPIAVDGGTSLSWEELRLTVRRCLGRSLLLWSPVDADMGPSHPVVSGYATVWVDLRPDAARLRQSLDGKWRNQLVRAEAQDLQVHSVNAGPLVSWLAQRHEEHRRQVGYRALPVRFLDRMAEESPSCRDRLVMVAQWDGTPVAGVWLQIHHGSATYLIGYADAVGRRTDAMRLLLWRAMLALREREVRWLDLGGVATDRAPGLSRFKFGMGGEVTVEAGTYFRQLLL